MTLAPHELSQKMQPCKTSAGCSIAEAEVTAKRATFAPWQPLAWQRAHLSRFHLIKDTNARGQAFQKIKDCSQMTTVLKCNAEMELQF